MLVQYTLHGNQSTCPKPRRGAIVQIKNQGKIKNYMSENQFALCSFPYDAERLGTQ